MTQEEAPSDKKKPETSPPGQPAESDAERLKACRDSIGEALVANLNENVRRKTPTP